MVDITLFELHLDGSEFTANAPNSGVLGGEEETDETDAAGPPMGLFAGLALVVLFVVAAVAARKMGGSDDEEAALDDVE